MWTIVKSGVAAAIAVAAVAATAPSAAQAEAEFKLRYSDLGPPRGSRPEAMMWWADEIKKRTNGRVEIEFFWSQSLVKAKETMKAVGAGLIESGTVLGVYTPADVPIWNVANTPFLFQDNWVGMRSMAELRKMRPELQEEAQKKGVIILANYTTGLANLFSREKPITTTADIQGMKIRLAGGWAKLLKKLGASPVAIGYGEIYQALDRGTIDATQAYTVAVESYKHYEVGKHLTLARMGQLLGYGAAISRRTWNGMPEDLQQIILEVSDELHEEMARIQITAEADVERRAPTEGFDGKIIEVHELTPETAAEWEAAAGEFLEDWKADMAKRGYDGEGILADLMMLRTKYRKELAEQGYPWDR